MITSWVTYRKQFRKQHSFIVSDLSSWLLVPVQIPSLASFSDRMWFRLTSQINSLFLSLIMGMDFFTEIYSKLIYQPFYTWLSGLCNNLSIIFKTQNLVSRKSYLFDFIFTTFYVHQSWERKKIGKNKNIWELIKFDPLQRITVPCHFKIWKL